jgi:hypothetical protein
MPHHPSSTTDDRVVDFRTGRAFQPSGNRTEGPHADDLDQYARGAEPDDFRHRMVVNAIAFMFVAALVLAGFWLADTIATMRKTQDCILTGKRGCAPVEAPAPAR